MSGDIEAQPLPPWELPKADAIVTVRAIDTTTDMCSNAVNFVEPVIPGHEQLNMTTLAFLIEHQSTDQKVLFDAGSRKDYWNFPPFIFQSLLKASLGLKIEKNVSEILHGGGVDLKDVQAIIWSHWHWDHIGDVSLFPRSTEIVVGPGFKENFMPGYPVNDKAPLLQSDFEGRNVREIVFHERDKIGPYETYDFFGDGSLYLLNVPGHAIGHIGALARTTPDTFVFLGADTCHFAGAFRPTKYNPLPSEIGPKILPAARFGPSCPCSLFTSSHPNPEHSRTTPFYSVATGKSGQRSFSSDPDEAQRSVDKLKEYDAHPQIFVCVSHDMALLDLLPLFNDNPAEDINDWKKKGYKDQACWRFLSELPNEDGSPGRQPPLVEGCWREGKLIPKD